MEKKELYAKVPTAPPIVDQSTAPPIDDQGQGYRLQKSKRNSIIS